MGAAIAATAMTGGMTMAMGAEAQTFVDLFAGRSFPEHTAATITADQARVNGAIVPARLRVDVERLEPTRSTIYGARVGHWFGAFGIAFDATTLDPDVKRRIISGSTGDIRVDLNVRNHSAVGGVSLAF